MARRAGRTGAPAEAPPGRPEYDPRAGVYVIDHVKPGSEVERRVQVVNGTPDAADVSLYAAAAAETQGGSFVGAEGRTQNELSSWTTVTPTSAELGPGERTFADVAIEIPADASSGERYATVWAEVTTPPDTAGGITQVSRVGVRVYLSVGPGGEPASDITIRSFTAERDAAGTPVVQLTVRNTGGRALDLTGELTLSDGPTARRTVGRPVRAERRDDTGHRPDGAGDGGAGSRVAGRPVAGRGDAAERAAGTFGARNAHLSRRSRSRRSGRRRVRRAALAVPGCRARSAAGVAGAARVVCAATPPPVRCVGPDHLASAALTSSRPPVRVFSVSEAVGTALPSRAFLMAAAEALGWAAA